MADDNNLENQTLDQIEHPKPAPKKRKIKFSFDLIVAIVLSIAIIATLVMWYLAVAKP